MGPPASLVTSALMTADVLVIVPIDALSELTSTVNDLVPLKPAESVAVTVTIEEPVAPWVGVNVRL